MKTLQPLIDAAKFDWVDEKIVSNFPLQEVRGEFRLFHFECRISSQDAISEMQKEGYEPANATEVLTYAPNEWNGEDFVAALGQSARVNGLRLVPCLYGDGRERFLNLHWWSSSRATAYCRFLGVRTSSLESQSSPPDTLPLILEINGLKYKRIL